jgi:membrane protein YdbS with pleckstrin-like domain
MSLAIDPDEEVLELCRRHWVFLYPRLLLLAMLALAPVIALFVALWRLDLLAGRGWQVAGALSAVWLLYWAVRLVLVKYRYDNDIWVVTTRRVIDSVSNHPLHLHTSAADIVDIQDVTVTSSGLLATLFDFGDIECQTAGTRQNFSLRSVPRPHEVQALVNRLRDDLRSGAG